MKVEIVGLNTINEATKEKILLAILSRGTTTMGWIKWALGILRINGRTNIYNTFQVSYYYNERNNIQDSLGRVQWSLSPQQEEERAAAVKEILRQSDLQWWVHEYLKTVNIEEAARTIAPYLENTLNIIARLEGMQTN